jgi:hypothetical protein
MEVEFEVTAEDIQAFRRYHRRRAFKAPMYLILMIVLLALLGTVGLILYQLAKEKDWVGFLLISCFGLGLFHGGLSTFLVFYYFARRQLAERNRRALGPHRVLLDPEGIRHVTRDEEGLLRWTGVREVCSNKDYLFLYLNATVAFIIPRRAYPDDTAFLTVSDNARRWHQEAATAPFSNRNKTSPETFHAKDDRIHDSGPPGL